MNMAFASSRHLRILDIFSPIRGEQVVEVIHNAPKTVLGNGAHSGCVNWRGCFAKERTRRLHLHPPYAYTEQAPTRRVWVDGTFCCQ